MSNHAHLLIINNDGILKTHPLTNVQYIIGRSGGPNDIDINSNIVSSQHGIITRINGNYIYNDLASLNGTNVKGKQIKGINGQPSAPVKLKNGDVLYIGANNGNRVYMVFTLAPDSNIEWKSISAKTNKKITVGRDPSNDIAIPNITVSRNHAVFTTENGKLYINDLKSRNGTIINGNTITGKTPIHNTDTIRISNSIIVRVGEYLVYGIPVASSKPVNFETVNLITPNEPVDHQAKNHPVYTPQQFKYSRKGGVQVEVQNISRIVKCKNGTGINGSNKKYILQNVSLTINPGELVAILGGSGAGKTTFMNCINGFEPATSGRVLVNGTDLIKNYQIIKSSIGYVPQQDIVHDNLTLESMLTYTGKLRLPKDVTKQELSQRVHEVLEMVDLTAQKDTYIKKLSGGQRKRASIAVELISDPSLFFLDEPTSGLDPEAETNLMKQLKNLSMNEGKTVIVITHTLQNIHLFDKVIFLAPGGKLCFYGSPADANQFFGVTNLADAYKIISDNVDGYVNKYNASIQRGAY